MVHSHIAPQASRSVLSRRAPLAASLTLALCCACSGAKEGNEPPDIVASAPEAKPASGARAAAAPAAGPLAAAHQAYLGGDFLAMGERIREVLLDSASTDLIRENSLELLDKAYRIQNGALPSRFTPPPGYGGLQLASRRFTTPHGPLFELRFAGSTEDASHLKGLSVRRLPGEVLMDKASGKGTFSVRHDALARSRGVEEFVIDSGPLEGPPADGVLELRMELDDGTVSEGFVIARGLTPPAAPEILSPAASELLSGPNPTVRWAAPHSTQATTFERRRMGIHLSHQGEDASAWEFSTKTPDALSEIRLGSAAGTPEVALTPGGYWLSLSAVESRIFGPVEILRATRVSRPFSVAR